MGDPVGEGELPGEPPGEAVAYGDANTDGDPVGEVAGAISGEAGLTTRACARTTAENKSVPIIKAISNAYSFNFIKIPLPAECLN